MSNVHANLYYAAGGPLFETHDDIFQMNTMYKGSVFDASNAILVNNGFQRSENDYFNDFVSIGSPEPNTPVILGTYNNHDDFVLENVGFGLFKSIGTGLTTIKRAVVGQPKKPFRKGSKSGGQPNKRWFGGYRNKNQASEDTDQSDSSE